MVDGCKKWLHKVTAWKVVAEGIWRRWFRKMAE